MDSSPRISITRADRGYELTASLRLPRRREEVFPFFAAAENLERITPSSVRFRIDSSLPIEMKVGALIDYSLRIRGLPVKWRSEITAWEPPERFVDEQRRGPYRWWSHEHRFIEDGDGTIVRDRVRYGVPGGRFVHALVVGRDVREIFEYRSRTLLELFAADRVLG